MVDPQSQADPKFQTTFSYTRITAKGVRDALIEQKNYRDEQLPAERKMSTILNRMGYVNNGQKTNAISARKFGQQRILAKFSKATDLEKESQQESGLLEVAFMQLPLGQVCSRPCGPKKQYTR